MENLSDDAQFKIQKSFTDILQVLGQDTDRDGLKDTPKRYTKFLVDFLDRPQFNFTMFDNDAETDEMIIVEKIRFASLCEHHTLPFMGYGWIAYIPDNHLVGLSKFERVLSHFAAGFQNQERITQQVAEFIDKKASPKGVAVCLKAMHTCMTIRGAKAWGSHTTTTALKGVFSDKNNYAKDEFMKSVNSEPFRL